MRIRSVLALTLLVTLACSEPTASPSSLVTTPAAALLPPWSYNGPKVPFPGQHSELLDVNDRGHMVGFAGDDAVLLDLHGGTYWLNKAGGTRAEARAVNASAAAAGWVYGTWQNPAIWLRPTSAPILRPEFGWVWDMNDRAEAVGSINVNGVYQAFYWEATTGTFTVLPMPRGATWTQATGINNDRVVVGLSGSGGVMWRLRSTGWVVTRLKGIDPWAVDAGYGTVGTDRNGRPAWGNPHLARIMGAGGIANGIHPGGTISGGMSAVLYGTMDAFVADRSGAITFLPAPAGAQGAQAYNSATCGLVVGSSYNPAIFANQAVYWDPGC
ncbi:MAG: hypothetical protein IT361_05640 [Gemmatimonadaceae bacterium]|nr:hypothetical protein [Gemmatimonadaceae bacterium]